MSKQTDAGQPREFIVDADLEGARLDRVLEQLLPGSGLRQRRRLVDTGRVLVEGRPAPASLKMRPGQKVTLLPEELPQTAPVKVRIIASTPEYVALEKPAGLHSASLAGGTGPSLEAMLPGLVPGKTPRLLNRLDFLTTGIVLAALNVRAAKVFGALPSRDIVKEYLAVVHGRLDEHLQLRRMLDTDDRKRTRVLGRMDPEEANWTLVWPMKPLAGDRTLVRVRIQSGARHQIRAHLAAASLPIVGDALYGEDEGGPLFLHHRQLEFPGFKAVSQPHWLKGLERGTSPAEAAVESLANIPDSQEEI